MKQEAEKEERVVPVTTFTGIISKPSPFTAIPPHDFHTLFSPRRKQPGLAAPSYSYSSYISSTNKSKSSKSPSSASKSPKGSGIRSVLGSIRRQFSDKSVNKSPKSLKGSQIGPRMPIHTKHGETVEFNWDEQEPDYDGMEWFKDPPPPRHEPQSSPPQVTESYTPSPNVVEENERFIYALKHAPNVLYARFKQYGQLGVLGWCSEFSELIDALKTLGFNGNMFVATREQALKTCSEILKLRLDVKMQIIIMYLSSQVARLRRFLDGEATYDDYPATDFPVESRQYTNWSSL